MMRELGKDPLQPWETQIIIKTHGFYKIVRMLTKMGFMFLIAAAFVFPLTGILLLLPPNSLFQQEALRFYAQLNSLGALFLTWQGLYLIFGATVTCYLLLFAAEAYWPRSALPFDTWSSILSIVEPAGSVIFGVLIVNEQFPPVYLFIVVFLLSLSILLRYVHETSNKVLAYVALSVVPQREKQVFQDLYQIKAIQNMSSVVGDYDLVLFIQSNSIVAFNRLVSRKLISHPDIEKVKVFLIEEVIK
jgi:DNA-binding Lrp family transcriptional regulator